jgi:hypothetical protein
MTFQNEEHFGNYLGQLAEKSGEELTEWEQSKGFYSSRAKYNSTLTAEEQLTAEEPLNRVLATVLNAKNIVRVNPWLFKLNPTTKKVYALSVSYANEISLLDSDTPSDSRIGVFNFDDDVFDQLDGNPRSDEECQDSQTGAKSTGDLVYCTGGSSNLSPQIGDRYRLVRIKYDGGGLYKSLYLRFQHTQLYAVEQPNNVPKLTWSKVLAEASFKATFKRRNQTEQSKEQIVSLNAANTAFTGWNTGIQTSDKDWNIYNATICLSAYSLNGKIYHYNKCTNKIETIDMGTIKSK